MIRQAIEMSQKEEETRIEKQKTLQNQESQEIQKAAEISAKEFQKPVAKQEVEKPVV